MARFLELLLMLIALSANINAQVLRQGSCPAVTPMAELDVKKYMGIWYEQMHSRRWTGLDLKCSTEYFESTQADSFQVNSFTYSPVANRTFHIRGVAHIKGDKGAQGKLEIHIPDFKIDGEVWILGTDYTSYTVMWSCMNADRLHFENVVIMTRSSEPDPKSITPAVGVLIKNKIERTYMQYTSHSKCPHIDAVKLSKALPPVSTTAPTIPKPAEVKPKEEKKEALKPAGEKKESKPAGEETKEESKHEEKKEEESKHEEKKKEVPKPEEKTEVQKPAEETKKDPKSKEEKKEQPKTTEKRGAVAKPTHKEPKSGEEKKEEEIKHVETKPGATTHTEAKKEATKPAEKKQDGAKPTAGSDNEAEINGKSSESSKNDKNSVHAEKNEKRDEKQVVSTAPEKNDKKEESKQKEPEKESKRGNETKATTAVPSKEPPKSIIISYPPEPPKTPNASPSPGKAEPDKEQAIIVNDDHVLKGKSHVIKKSGEPEVPKNGAPATPDEGPSAIKLITSVSRAEPSKESMADDAPGEIGTMINIVPPVTSIQARVT